MKHKHAELIKAWADGAIIEARYYKATGWTDWEEEMGGFIWYQSGAEYRIKPRPLPDVQFFLTKSENGWVETAYGCFIGRPVEGFIVTRSWATGEIKSVEILK